MSYLGCGASIFPRLFLFYLFIIIFYSNFNYFPFRIEGEGIILNMFQMYREDCCVLEQKLELKDKTEISIENTKNIHAKRC